MLVYPLGSGGTALVDPIASTPEVEPTVTINLPAVHPTTLFLLPGNTEDVGVVTSPYGMAPSRMDLYRIVGGCSALHLGGVELGTFNATFPSVERVVIHNRQLLVVGTGNGVQVYEVQ